MYFLPFPHNPVWCLSGMKFLASSLTSEPGNLPVSGLAFTIGFTVSYARIILHMSKDFF